MDGNSGHRFLPLFATKSSLTPKSMRLLALFFLLISALTASAVAPGRATALTAVASANKSIKLTWVAPDTETTPAATAYRVLRTPTAAPTTPVDLTPTPITGLTFTDSSTSLVAGTSYTYTVVALNGTDAASPSDPAIATPVDLPGGPSNLHTTAVTTTSVSLAWNAVTGATRYNVYRDDDLLDDVTGTTFIDTDVTIGETYTYVVTAENVSGESADSNIVTVTIGDGTGKQAVFARRFRQIDVNANGSLSLNEYIAGHGGRLAWVVVKHRFVYSDTDGSGTLSLAEYAKALGGRKYLAPTKPRQFYLADTALEERPEFVGVGDGFLDEAEYTLMLGARTSPLKVTKAFNKKNKDNEDEGLTPLELGIRNYVAPEPPEEEEDPEVLPAS